VVLKSTTPIGTAEGVDFRLRSLLDADIELVLNPEFLRQGSAVADFLQPDRIVIGSNTPVAGDMVAALYCGIDAPIIRTDWRTAEMIKHAANAFLATRVSFINEIASLSTAFGTDIDAIIAGIGVDPRIGSSFLKPGIGFGGSCLPRDLVALATSGLEHNVSTPLLSAVREVNDTQIIRARDLIATELQGLKGKRVAAWGATFKQGSEDTRESPAIRVVELLLEAGATVAVYDPALREASLLPPGAERGSSALDCCEGADAVVVLTDWPEFQGIELTEVARRMNGRLLFDGRNALDPKSVEAAGLRYRGIGRGLSRPVEGRTGVPHD
jgi:UDPglucose 6-dehydrogenase